MTAKKFILAAENYGLSPLPHYFEEIYANLTGIEQLGMRGDRNYIFYSKKSMGQAYNEEHEMRLSGESAYAYLGNRKHQKQFFKSCEEVINDIHAKITLVDNADIGSLSTQQLGSLFIELNYLHGRCFSHYIVSQPFRLRLFEQDIAKELKKE